MTKSGIRDVRSVIVGKDVAQFKRATEEYVRKATTSAKAANNALTRIGTHTRKGELTKHYR